MKDLSDLFAQLERLVVQADREFSKLEKADDVVRLCVAFFKFGVTYDCINELRLRLYHIQDRINKIVIPESLERFGTDKIAVPEIGRSFYILPKYTATILNKEEAMEWLRGKNLGALITETVNAGTLAATLKKMILDEGVDPPECIDFKSYKVTGDSKYTPKKEIGTKKK